MPNAYVFTATLEHARQVAISALEDPNGLTITFLAENYGGSFEAAGRAARTFQTTFSSMRSKARRMKQRHKGEISTQLDSIIDHDFDRLAAMRNAMPHERGWEVHIIPATMVHIGAIVTSNSTGEVIAEFDPDERAMTAIRNKLFYTNEEAHKEKRKPIYPLTVAEDTYARARDPLWVETARFYGFDIPGDASDAQSTDAGAARLDDMEDALADFGKDAAE